MTLEHGRTRYTRGCRCDVCKTAERDYQRNRYRRERGLPVDTPDPPKLNVVDYPPISSPDGSVVAAVRAELGPAPAAAERPGLTAVALALAAILDGPQHVAVQPGSTATYRGYYSPDTPPEWAGMRKLDIAYDENHIVDTTHCPICAGA